MRRAADIVGIARTTIVGVNNGLSVNDLKLSFSNIDKKNSVTFFGSNKHGFYSDCLKPSK